MRNSPTLAWRWFAAMILLMSDPLAMAQQPDEKPKAGRAAQLNFQQGEVVFSPGRSNRWYDSEPGRPLAMGDRIWVHEGARVELRIAATTLRAAGPAGFHLERNEDSTVRFMVDQGTVQMRVRDTSPTEPLEVGSDNTSFAVRSPGAYELEATGSGGMRVTPLADELKVFRRGQEDVNFPISAGQQLVIRSPQDVSVELAPPRGEDAFSLWAAQRHRLEAPAGPAPLAWNEVGTTPARTARPMPAFWVQREREIAQAQAERERRREALARSREEDIANDLRYRAESRERDREEQQRRMDRLGRQDSPKFDPPRISFPSPPQHQFNLPRTPPPAPTPWVHPR